MNILPDIQLANQRIDPYILRTPVEHSPYLSKMCEADVWLKLEHLQITGSFKLRGATNKVLSLSDTEKERGVITASTGNHGSAFAYIADKLNCKGSIYLPPSAAKTKVEMMRMYKVDLEFFGKDSVDAELEAKRVAEEEGRLFLSPYNDREIVAGQGTIGVELEEQVPDLDSVLVPVGGGGLISGIAGYLKAQKPEVEVIGCQPANSAVMYESIKADEILDIESLPTLSDGTAGGMEPDSITFDMCKAWVDDYIVVSEEEIRAGLRFLLEKHYFMVEGAAALSVASLLQQKHRFKGKTVVLILCGRKLGLETLKEILS
ncbi:MAG: threonine/serine dehydratase [Bacteroidota bacterium]